MYKSIYIHVPFCKKICTYCDFKREINSEKNINIYIDKIINEINLVEHKLETIYIGGGTPNILSDETLNKFLSSLQKNINENTEFTIELNPELVTDSQIEILKKNRINRISLGVQSTNNNILLEIGRLHTIEMVKDVVQKLYKYSFNNVSCDFIYNLPNMNISDVDDMLNFLNEYNIKHLSFYSLEIKEGSILNKNKYTTDAIQEEDYLFYFLKKTNLTRYEIANWTIDKKYESKHNKCYWDMKDWRGIGYGSFGLENNYYIEAVGTTKEWEYKFKEFSIEDRNKDILIMGLRKVEGINLNNKENLNAFNAFKDVISKDLIYIENDFLKVKDINLLNEILICII